MLRQKSISAVFTRAALNYYGKTKFPAVQLVWTGRNDKFPWEEHFEKKFLYVQPLLDRNADFKFREEKRLTVFTTRQWLELGKPILHVVHNTDGDWLFLTGDQMPDDIRIVALEDLVKKDQTLNQVFALDYGYSMEREATGRKWTRQNCRKMRMMGCINAFGSDLFEQYAGSDNDLKRT